MGSKIILLLTLNPDLCYDEYVKKLSALVISGFLLILLFLPVLHAHASSQQAYQDYLYQFDLYRQKYSDFSVAKNAYDKFKTLESESKALSATKTMLSQRDLLLHAYLVYLFERVGEQGGITTVNKQLYQSLLTNELAFLETQSGLVSSINSIDDATTTSEQLESHYDILSATIDEIIAGISLGQLNVIYQNFNLQVTNAQNIYIQNSALLGPDKLTTIKNWVQQITSKQTLYQQKIDETTTQITGFSATNNSTDLGTQFGDVTTKIGQAKQYLSDSIANLGEVVTAMQYKN